MLTLEDKYFESSVRFCVRINSRGWIRRVEVFVLHIQCVRYLDYSSETRSSKRVAWPYPWQRPELQMCMSTRPSTTLLVDSVADMLSFRPTIVGHRETPGTSSTLSSMVD